MPNLKPTTEQLKIDGCWRLTPSAACDWRGDIFSLYNEHYELEFVEDKISRSRQNVLRGLHGDFTTTKLISCLAGSIYFVIADMRRQSPTFGHWDGMILNEANRHQVIVPAGVLNGHLCLSESCVFWYKQTQMYGGQDAQFTVSWRDETLSIDWPINSPILSVRDRYDTVKFESIVAPGTKFESRHK